MGDSFDPIIQSGSTNYSLTNWSSFSNSSVWSCEEKDSGHSWYSRNGGFDSYTSKETKCGVVPVFEVPVM